MANTKVEVAFELTVGDTPYFRLNDPVKGKLNNTSYRLAGPIWIDITNRVANVNIKRGKNRELDRYSAGVATITLHNEDRAFDPLNDASPYVGNIIPRRAVRVSTADVTQFTGVIDDWNLDYSVGGKANAVIVASDAFSLLAQQSLTAGTATAQTTGERINAVLSMPSVGWPLTQRSIDTGLATVGADVWASDNNVLTYLQKVEASEQGQLFMNRDGYVRFVNGGVTPETFGDWELSRTNLVTNPSMETVTSGSVVMRRNLVTNPSVEVDTTGWTTSGGTIARVTTQAYVGTASLQLTANSYNGALYDVSGVAASQTYTSSIWVKGTAGDTVQLELSERDSGGATVGTTSGTVTTLTGSWQRLTVTRTFGSTGVNARFIIRNTSATSSPTYWDALMLEASSTASDYFDGSTTDALGWDYAWSGTANASISTAACAATTVRTNLVTNPSIEVDTTGWTASGGTIARVTTQAYVGTASLELTANSYNGALYDVTSVAASQTYTSSVWVKGTAGDTALLELRERDSGGATVGTTSGTVTTLTGSWQRLTVTRTFGSTGVNARLIIRNTSATSSPTYWDALQLEVGSTASDYFDGSFSPAGDFSYAWTGTANASTSIQRGATVTSWTGGTAVRVQTRSEKYVGSSSLAVYAQANDQYGNHALLTVTPSTTYTFSAWVKGTVGKSVYIVMQDSPSGGQTSSIEVAMTGSWQRISVTRTVSATATGVYVYIRNGSSSGVHTFYVDAAMMEASPIVQDYFDGSTTPTTTVERYAWTGTANASTSTKEIRQPIIYPTFSDQNDGIPYTATAISYGTELLYNQVAVKYSGGTETASNAISQAKYGITGTEVDTLLSTNAAAQSLATFWVTKYGEPEYRFQDIEVSLDGTPVDKVKQVLNIELGDIVFIKFTPNNVGSAIERYGQIIKKEHSIVVDRHNIVFGLAALPFSFLELDSTSIGILDENVLAF